MYIYARPVAFLSTVRNISNVYLTAFFIRSRLSICSKKIFCFLFCPRAHLRRAAVPRRTSAQEESGRERERERLRSRTSATLNSVCYFCSSTDKEALVITQPRGVVRKNFLFSFSGSLMILQLFAGEPGKKTSARQMGFYTPKIFKNN